MTLTVVTGSCPHAIFLEKHVCSDCITNEDALEFSKLVRTGQRFTGQNSVIIGEPMFKVIGGRCVNDPGVTVIQCNLQSNFCYKKGNDCTTQHDTSNGHLYYQEIYCH